jgi:hypothetical protein
MKVEKELRRLKEILPIEEHQKKLTPELRRVHREVLRSFAELGRPLEGAKIAQMVPGKTVPEVLTLLASEDLVVLDEKKREWWELIPSRRRTRLIRSQSRAIRPMPCVLWMPCRSPRYSTQK